jgi:uncharacterized protein (DUF983 family)
MGKGAILKDILMTKCPRCRDESMFKYSTLKLRKLLKMHRYCPNCGQDFMPEPGFYIGAMYFSYAINVALMVTFGFAIELIFNPENILITLASVFIPTLVLAPWNFRISRAIMLFVFGGITKD